jgi:uncharacterized protein (TIGR02145 family)
VPLPSIDTTIQSVTIGSQIWSTKNLDVARYRNGDSIPQVTDPAQWANLTTGAWCWYNNDSATYAATYGRLYNWYAVNDPRGLAPQGWRIPTEGDWNKLIKYLDAGADTNCLVCFQSTVSGNSMKNTLGWYNNRNGSNTSGFSGLPGGYRDFNGNFYDAGSYGLWWSGTQYDPFSATYRGLTYQPSDIYRNYTNKTLGLSLRIVRE